MNRYSSLLIAGVAVGADRVLKWWAGQTLALSESRPLLGHFIRLTRVHNVGGALGIFPGGGELFIAVSIAVSVTVIVILLRDRTRSAVMKVGLALLLAGAVGNLIDRLAYGYVLDFLEFRGLFVNNLADVCVSVGTVLVIIHTIFGGGNDRTEAKTDRL